jgi:hypothetical protein
LNLDGDNLFAAMFEADDPPEADIAAPPEAPPEPATDSPPAADASGDGGDPPEAEMTDMGSADMGGSDGFQDEGGGDDGQGGGQPEEDNTTLDEKSEIFAKIKIYKSYRQLHQKIEDTIGTIDKIDLVQTGNNINQNDVLDVKDSMSELMDDVFTTIVYEFQQSYANLKVKLVQYSAKYVLYMKDLVKLIKKDQATNAE